ncbi:hypothetical protein [Lentzea sp. NBRC 102530]|uniref:hypothetical protein n=1 Tax=Lentzea sp. NBRC 102530 TaxID=3032201 RepID=UPI00249FD816|nr:hypothetical protein [Lentzea sp. NBRC 102530]GLY51858.1 hypothetical protein Lesp01_55140 [Lentzea sp. NBRC 102530]
MNRFWEHEYFRALLALELPVEDFAVTGSAVLYAHGLIDDPRDLDVLARGAAWERARRLGEPKPTPLAVGAEITLGDIQILDRWFPGWNTAALIDEADVLHGLRFVRLGVIRATKARLGRPRDLEHVALIDAHFAKWPEK